MTAKDESRYQMLLQVAAGSAPARHDGRREHHVDGVRGAVASATPTASHGSIETGHMLAILGLEWGRMPRAVRVA